MGEKEKTPEELAIDRQSDHEVVWKVTPEQAKKIKKDRVKKLLKRSDKK